MKQPSRQTKREREKYKIVKYEEIQQQAEANRTGIKKQLREKNAFQDSRKSSTGKIIFESNETS